MNLFVIVINYGNTSSCKISNILNQLNINHLLYDPGVMPTYQELNKLTHIILSGGPKHVYDNQDQLPDWVIEINRPVLAICYGMQLVAHHFGGKVIRNKKEKGIVYVTEIINGKIISKPRWMNRYDNVIIVPPQFTIIGITNNNDIAVFTDYKKWYCFQYHPEVSFYNYIDKTIFYNFFNL